MDRSERALLEKRVEALRRVRDDLIRQLAALEGERTTNRRRYDQLSRGHRFAVLLSGRQEPWATPARAPKGWEVGEDSRRFRRTFSVTAMITVIVGLLFLAQR